MAYCTVADVQRYLTNVTITTASQPTKEEVSGMCDDVSDNIIDPIIRNYVTLPLTDSVGKNYLKQGAIYFVLASVQRAFFGVTELVISLEDKFEEFLDKLKSNNALLELDNSNYPKTASSTRRTPKYNLDYDEDLW